MCPEVDMEKINDSEMCRKDCALSLKHRVALAHPQCYDGYENRTRPDKIKTLGSEKTSRPSGKCLGSLCLSWTLIMIDLNRSKLKIEIYRHLVTEGD